MNSSIITSLDVVAAKDELLSKIDSKLVKIYECEEFKVDDSKAVIKEAYIAEEKSKYIIILAQTYRIEAQNALLKLLEEPPRNIIFILIARSKTALLPTIRSRMQIENFKCDVERLELGLDLKKMQLADLFEFLKKHKNIKKQELKAIIQELLKESVVKAKINLLSSELELFDKALLLSELNSRPQTLLSTLLLTIYHARGRKV
jgi:DNA polymerase-3 subunit delta'